MQIDELKKLVDVKVRFSFESEKCGTTITAIEFSVGGFKFNAQFDESNDVYAVSLRPEESLEDFIKLLKKQGDCCENRAIRVEQSASN